MANTSTENQIAEEVTEVNEQISEQVDAVEESTEETKELSPEEKLKEMQARRMGTFKLEMSYSDAVYFRNTLDKAPYKGPQQAYLLIISKLEISQICESLKGGAKEDKHQVELTSATLESISYFLNNREGTGADSAQKLFTASMVLRPAISEINKLDSEIEELSQSLKSND